jgi:hypothetical protein
VPPVFCRTTVPEIGKTVGFGVRVNVSPEVQKE